MVTLVVERVDRLCGHIHEAGEVASPANCGVEFLALVQREGHVFCRERFAITPSDAVANLDDQFGEVIVVLIALRQPHDLFIGESAIECQRLVHQADGELVVRYRDEWIPLVIFNELAFVTAAYGNECLFAGMSLIP